jgi:hypothetical protein
MDVAFLSGYTINAVRSFTVRGKGKSHSTFSGVAFYSQRENKATSPLVVFQEEG